MNFIINDATNELMDSNGRIGKFEDGDQVYIDYLEWSLNGGILEHIYEPKIENKRIISKLEFMDRFTMNELAEIYNLSETQVMIKIWLNRFNIAEFIDLDNDKIIYANPIRY